ncbi:sunset domain-containing protein [Mycolicibacterium thermoresistibile]
MNGQWARTETALGRFAACLLAVATMTLAGLLSAPEAAATPEEDAGAAIGAAYDASGGPGGPLGPPDGGVYPIGAGFAQNYAHGKMFFTPQTGAHFMQGEILAKYESLGGPADSDLGFPTLSESPGRVGPDSRNVIFSAPDRPVIFWTPDTGARVVRGAINLAWDRLGGSAGVLGVPAEDEAYRGDVVTQRFSGGEISWNRKTREFSTVPPELADQLADLDVPQNPTAEINAARRAAGGALGPLGAKEGDEYPIGDDGVAQDFTGGTIFYSPATGAHVLTGQVLEKYRSVGGPEGDLGFPISGEHDGGAGGRMAGFAAADEPIIFWTPDYGAVIVRGAMKAAWDKLGGAAGELGVPVDDQTEDGDEITQRFSGGSITWNRSDGSFRTEPAGLAAQLTGLEVPGVEPPADIEEAPLAQSEDGGGPSRPGVGVGWLLVLIPVLVLAAALIGLTIWNRRRRYAGAGHLQSGQYDPEHHDSERYDPEHHDSERYDPERYDQGPDAFDSDVHDPGGYDTREDLDRRHETPSGDAAPQPSELFGLGTPPAQADFRGWGYTGDPATPADEARTATPPGEPGDKAPPEPHRADSASAESGQTRTTAAATGGAETLGAPPDQLPGQDESTEPERETPSEDPFFEKDQDDVDTAPTPIVAPEAAEPRPSATRPDSETTGRHAAIDVDEPEYGQTALRLPADGDPRRPPEGYPIKARITDGLYWVPGSADYDEVDAEIWFASEELARTNGFVRSD